MPEEVSTCKSRGVIAGEGEISLGIPAPGIGHEGGFSAE